MTLSLVKPSGWAFGEILTSAQAEALDSNAASGVDGVGGGTYTPSVAIQILGPGLVVSNLTVNGTLTLLGNETIGNSPSDTLTVLATSTFSSPVTFNDPVVANDIADFWQNVTVHTAALLTVGGNASIGNDSSKNLTVGATSTFNAPITANDSVDLWGATTVHSSVPFLAGGDVQLGIDSSKLLSLYGSLNTVLSYTGIGRIPWRDGGTLPNGDSTIRAQDGQVFRINPAATAYRQYTLSTTGAGSGDWMLFWQGQGNSSVSTYGAQIVSPTLEQNTFSPMFTGKNSQWALYFFHSGGWYLVASTA